MPNPPSSRMPVVFVGHGSPMNAITDNAWSRGFVALGASLPRPRAILAISAHWYDRGTWLTGNVEPRTIHDFGGFPDALYEIEYPAPGSPDLARRVLRLLGDGGGELRDEWGLDHGTWCVLHKSHPRADIPVVQLSIDARLKPRQHYEIGRRLADLRDEGVLVLASGNVTHNLGDAFRRMEDAVATTPEWAARFDRDTAAALDARDHERLIALWPGSADGKLAHPSPDHWLPLLYAAGASSSGDEVRYPMSGFDLGSLSMRSVRFG